MRHGSILLAAALGIFFGLVLAACGSSTTPAVCEARDDLQQSVDSLTDLNLLTAGPSGIRDQFDEVQANAEQFADETEAQFPDETKKFNESLDDLRASIDKFEKDGLSAVLAQLPGQIQAFATATQDLADAVKSECD